jgi:NAD(P)H-flavin reductase
MGGEDQEQAVTYKKGGDYAEPKGFDIKRIENTLAKVIVFLGYAWFAVFLLFTNTSWAPRTPGGKNDLRYGDAITTPMQKLICPVDKYGKNNVSYCTWYYPAMLSFTFVCFFIRKVNFRPSKPSFRLAGDMDFKMFTWIAAGIPLTVYFSFYMYQKWPVDENWGTNDPGTNMMDMAGTWANRLGYVAIYCLTFFMIPATRHGPVLSVLGWHPYHACTIHMWLGWGSFWFSWLHFIFYIAKYASPYYPNARNDLCNDGEGMPGWRWVFPSSACFTYNKKPEYEWFNPETNETEMIIDPCLGDCGKQINGFYGTVAIFFMTCLAVTSMQVFRRYKYTVFYFTHIICAPIFLAFVMMHWKYIYYFMMPSGLYYFATQGPFIVQHSRKTINNYGLKVRGVMDIPTRQTPKGQKEPPPPPQRSIWARIFYPQAIDWLDEQLNKSGPQATSIEHCVCFDFEVTEEGFEQFYPGMYGNIWCPDISMKSHPFSVTHVPGQTDQLRIIFRVFGKWTDLLARSLIQLPQPGYQQERLPIPKIMMDGWHGPDHLVASALDHDKVNIVTAGIGITAFLSMFTEMIEVLCFRADGMFVKLDEIEGVPLTKEFVLHWSCRDENLIKYITDEYFQPLIEESETYGGCSEDYNGVRCIIHIHRTGEAGAKTLNPNSLWKSFREKTERGLREIDYGLLGTFGTPWVPYRFSFGKWTTFKEHIPSAMMFAICIWTSYAGAQQLNFWIYGNPFQLADQLRNFIRWFFYIPIIGIPFIIGWVGHIMMDWFGNVESSKRNSEMEAKGTHKTVADDKDEVLAEPDHSIGRSLIGDGGRVGPNGEFVEEDAPEGEVVVFESNMIQLLSTSGRPNIDAEFEADRQAGYENIAVYMCGPEKMIEGCKTAAGTLSCNMGCERLQNFTKGNKFAFYEERFEW